MKTKSKFVKLHFDKDCGSCDGPGEGSYGDGTKGGYGYGGATGSGKSSGDTSGSSYTTSDTFYMYGDFACYAKGYGDCFGEADNTGGKCWLKRW